MFKAYTSGGSGFMTDPRFHRDLNYWKFWKNCM